MIAIAKLFALLPALAATSYAAPVIGSRAELGSLQAAQDGGQGIIEWAREYSASWKAPQDAHVTRSVTIPGPSYLVLDYTLNVESCGVPDLKWDTVDGLHCSKLMTSPCPLTHLAQTVTSSSYTLGTKVSVDVTVSGSVEVATVSEKVGWERDQTYSWTNTSSTSTSETFPVPPNKTCTLMEVYWDQSCTQSIDIQSFKWYGSDGKIMWPEVMGNVENLCSMWQSPKSSPPYGPPANNFQWLIAGNNDVSGNFQDDLGSHFDLITDICAGHIPTSLDGQLLTSSSDGQQKRKNFFGCEWS